jgi:hypothetical protein
VENAPRLDSGRRFKRDVFTSPQPCADDRRQHWNSEHENATHQLNRRAGPMKIQQGPQKMTAGTVLAMQLLADAGKIRVQKAPDGTPIVNQEDYETWLSKLTAAPR